MLLVVALLLSIGFTSRHPQHGPVDLEPAFNLETEVPDSDFA